MSNLEKVCLQLCETGIDAKYKIGLYGGYPESLNEYERSYIFMIKIDDEKKLVIFKKSSAYKLFTGETQIIGDEVALVCDLSHENAIVLREIFPYTKPISVLGYTRSIGLGDRIGLASAGHIRLMKKYDIKPILAQQSIRELNLTGRRYEGVLDDVSWAVYQEGYKGGFGADGDHLKTPEEVLMALGCHFTMITLDCSEYIDNSISDMTDQNVEEAYMKSDNSLLEAKYLEKEFILEDGSKIYFEAMDFERINLTYSRAIRFATKIYNDLIKNHSTKVDFEVSIDETLTPTSPQAHFFVVSELIDGGVEVKTIAPRFCGEFQKGIDYIGDISQFEKEFKIHTSIADHFGYKISVHSGSDKFSVFPIIGALTNMRFHVKTAGTNWLEAIRVIAKKKPRLYREIHEFALQNLDEAKKYYHISADVKNIPDISTLNDEDLPDLMNKADSRQVIHITYGLILQEKKDGSYVFRDRIYDVLNTFEEDYYESLYKHIEKHLSKLGM